MGVRRPEFQALSLAQLAWDDLGRAGSHHDVDPLCVIPGAASTPLNGRADRGCVQVSQQDRVKPLVRAVGLPEGQAQAGAHEAGTEDEDGRHSSAREIGAQAGGPAQVDVSDRVPGEVCVHVRQ